MRVRCPLVLTVFFMVGLVAADAAQATLPALLPQRPFRAGEHLTYRIRLGPVTVGTASLEFTGLLACGERTAYELRYTARSNGLLSTLYPVRDRIVTWADTVDFRSHRLQKRIREGSYREVWDLRLDHDAGLARPPTGPAVTIPPGCHDVFSALLRIRASRLEPGDEAAIPVILGGAVSVLRVAAIGHDDVAVPAGRFRCLTVRPQLGGEGPFRHDGPVEVALSQDHRRLPVRISVRVPVVGSLRVELVEISSNSPVDQIPD